MLNLKVRHRRQSRTAFTTIPMLCAIRLSTCQFLRFLDYCDSTRAFRYPHAATSSILPYANLFELNSRGFHPNDFSLLSASHR